MVKSKSSWSQIVKHGGPTNQSIATRKLQPQDLGAVIFGCTNNTIAECHSRQRFGLPRAHLSYVQNIKEGLPLFLFNYDDRKLHGIYEAASNGKFCPQSNAWSHDGKRKTGYPAQVAVRVRLWCFPLAESQFRNAILTNYYQRMPGVPGHTLHFFQFELDHSQTHVLMDMFTPLPSPKNFWTPPVATPGHEHVQKSILPPVWAPECESNNDLKSEKIVKSYADMVKMKKNEEVGTGGVNAEYASSSNKSSNDFKYLDCGDTQLEGEEYALSNKEAKVQQQQQSGQQDKELSFKWVAKMKNTGPTAINKLSPSLPAIPHQFRGTETQLMKAVYQTPNNNNDDSAPKAADPGAHPESRYAEFMSIRPLTISSSQEPMRDDNSLHKGRKRKRTTRAIQRSHNGHLEIQNTHQTELHSPDYVSWYVKDRLTGKSTCIVCGEEGHYTCDSPMKDQENKVICTLCNKVGHCHLWCCRQNVSENRACRRCGEKGHYTNKDLSHCDKKYTNRDLSCSSCDINHPLGRCPMGQVTCFLCEGKDHVPAQCRLSPMLTVTQYHRESFRAILKQALTETSRRAVTPVKPSGELEPHECQFKRDGETVHKVSSFNSSEQGPCERKSPIRSQVLDSDKTNHAAMTDKALTRVSRVTCFSCHEEGHYAKWCPKKKQPGELELYDVTCSSFHANRSRKKKPLRALELCDVTCFNCDDKGHYANSCPKKKLPEELEPYDGTHECQSKGDSETVHKVSSFNHSVQGHCERKSPIRNQVPDSDKTNHAAMTDKALKQVSRIPCFNCHEEGHFAKRCPKKKAPRELDLCDVTCFNCHGSHYTFRCPNKKPGELELRDVTCFNCYDKGHYRKKCPKKKPPGELEQ